MASATEAVRGLSHANEVFAQCLARGYTQTDAYKEAYPKSKNWKDASVTNKASALAKVAAIQARVQAIREPAVRAITANSAGYGLVEAMDEARQAFELAMSTEQVGAAVAAVQLRAKLNALLIERKEIKVSKFDDLEADDKQTLIETMRAEIARRKALAAPDQGVTDVEAKSERGS